MKSLFLSARYIETSPIYFYFIFPISCELRAFQRYIEEKIDRLLLFEVESDVSGKSTQTKIGT